MKNNEFKIIMSEKIAVNSVNEISQLCTLSQAAAADKLLDIMIKQELLTVNEAKQAFKFLNSNETSQSRSMRKILAYARENNVLLKNKTTIEDSIARLKRHYLTDRECRFVKRFA